MAGDRHRVAVPRGVIARAFDLDDDRRHANTKKAAPCGCGPRRMNRHLLLLAFRVEVLNATRRELGIAHGERHVDRERARGFRAFRDVLHVGRKRAGDETGGRRDRERDRGHGRVLKEILLRGRCDLTRIVLHRLADGIFANLFKCGNRHCGQKADDDDNDHDFNEGEALGRTTGGFHMMNNIR